MMYVVRCGSRIKFLLLQVAAGINNANHNQFSDTAEVLIKVPSDIQCGRLLRSRSAPCQGSKCCADSYRVSILF